MLIDREIGSIQVDCSKSEKRGVTIPKVFFNGLPVEAPGAAHKYSSL